ncbi:MAG: hypothetical protein WCH44_05580 [Betaproteobacteria bacterium]
MLDRPAPDLHELMITRLIPVARDKLFRCWVEDAAKLDVSIFDDARILDTRRVRVAPCRPCCK